MLIGIERGWKLREQEPGTRVAGVRTFSMLGLGSGIAGLLARLGHPFVAAAIVLGLVAMMVVAYARALETQHDSTSAVATHSASRYQSAFSGAAPCASGGGRP